MRPHHVAENKTHFKVQLLSLAKETSCLYLRSIHDKEICGKIVCSGKRNEIKLFDVQHIWFGLPIY